MEKLFSISFSNKCNADSLAEYVRNVYPHLSDAKALKIGNYWEVHATGEFTDEMFRNISLCGARIWDKNNRGKN